ncbi:hypothetical protein [Rhodococcus ruber]|nr:hypothetical protein [Rhodococcus ruber]
MTGNPTREDVAPPAPAAAEPAPRKNPGLLAATGHETTAPPGTASITTLG